MAETFSYCTRLGATGETAQRTWQNNFGDGYVQSGGTGINTRSETWDGMTIIGRLEAGDDLLSARAFLDRHEGYKSFLWTISWRRTGSIPVQWIQTEAVGGGLYELGFTFVQVFYP